MPDTPDKPKQKSGRSKGAKKKATPRTRSESIKAALPALAAGAGVEIPGDGASLLPELDVTQPVRVLARELGMLSRGTNLFARADGFVTVDEATGETRPMTAERMCSWVERVAWTYKPGREGKTFSRLGVELARLILAADDFRVHVRELRAVQLVRLPVWRGEGEGRTMELLPPGYDEAARIYTVASVPYDEDMDAGEAQAWLLNEVLAGYPWAEAEHGLAKCRSVSAHFAGMLTPFCALLLPDESMRPMLVYLANQKGAGKSTLAKMTFAPVHGIPAATNADANDAELEKIIGTAILEQRPYLFLDDMGNFKSRALNMVLTSPRVAVRVMGKSSMPELPNKMLVAVTGNMVNIGDELARRALIVDLFAVREATERTFEHPITDSWLALPDTRARLLAALWAFVRHWRDSGMPRPSEARRASYEAHASLVGSIVLALNMANPFAKREHGMGGDDEGEALKELLRTIADGIPDGESEDWTAGQIVEKAESLSLLDAIVPYAKDQKKALGHRLKHWRGRILQDTNGREFEIVRRKGCKGAIYPFRILRA